MIKKLLPDFCDLLRESNVPTKSLKVLLLFAVVLFGNLCTVSAQNVKNDYTFSESIGNPYADIVGGTTIMGPSGASNIDNVANFTTSYPIGFNFIFNNIQYTDVYISDNGYIFFKSPIGITPVPGVASGNALSQTTAYQGAVSGYGYNLVAFAGEAGEVSYLTSGTAGNRVFTVQYKNLRRFDGITRFTGLMNFQIKLYEVDNRIEVLYRDFVNPVTGNLTGQVGLRGPDNTFATNVNNRMNNGATIKFVTSAPGTANNSGFITRLLAGNVYGPDPGTSFVWSPCFNPTNLVTALRSDNSTVDFSWTAPLYSSGNYSWEVHTSGAPGSGTGLVAGGSGTTALTSATVTGLSVGGTYFFYVRSNCKTGAPWTQYITSTVNISCNTPFSVPYYEDFESSTGFAIPLCTTNTPTTGQALVARTTGTSLYGFTTKNLMTGGNAAYPSGSVAAANAWWFSHSVTLAAAGTYKLTYTYGGTREQAFFVQKMKVGYGTAAVAGAPAASDMTTILADHPTIRTSPNTFTVNFTVASGGTYYLGFNGYAAANNGFLQIDNIALENTTCFPPTGIVANPIGTNSASLNWTAPASNPSGGYDYYISTTNTAPLATTAPTGSVAAGNLLANITLLNPATTYYVWVRSNCGGSDRSQWSTVYSFTTTVPPCTPAPTSVDSGGIVNVTFGTINNSTGNEAPAYYGNYSALSNYVSQTTNANISLTYSISGYLGAGYYTKVWVDWNNDGDFLDTGEEVYNNGGSELPNGTSLISFLVPTSVGSVANTAGPHRMRIGGADDSTNINLNGPNQGSCYSGFSYATFEDYTIYVVPAPPALTISGSSVTYCSAGPGNASPTITVTSPTSNFDTYIWTPNNNITGDITSGWVFSPIVTTVYTLTASKLVAGVLYINTATYTVNVNQSPTAITITPSPAAYCQGDLPVKLTATGGILSGSTVFNETFNGSSTFTTAHGPGSNGGFHGVTFGYWALVNSPFALSSTNNTDPGTGPLSSNDASQFYVSDSDAQGTGGTTDELLISPVFSLVGYTDANLSFWHFYKGWVNGSADVDVSSNGGTTWTTLPGGSWNTTSQGTPTGFVNVVLSLASYATPGNTNSNMRIRFHYNNPVWGYRWAIDNVKVTGSAVSNSVWSPNTSLYTDVNGTVLYDGVSALASIYAKPSTTTVYTASVTSVASCVRTQTVTVNVTSLVGGTATGDQSVSCGATPSPISVSGWIPAGTANITGWQQAFNTTFTGATVVPGSANQSTLTLGPIGTTTYYRAIITGCNTTYSNYVTVTVAGANTFNSGVWSLGSFTPGDVVVINAGTWTVSVDTNVCSLQVKTGASVIVNSGITLTVDNAVNVVGTGTLTINDSGSLLQNPAATVNTNTGNIIYKRNSQLARKFDYTYWSSPVGLQTLSGIFTTPQQPLSDKYYWFNTTTYAWTNVATPALTTMTVGLGYIIRAPQLFDPVVPAVINATFTGVPNNGTYPVNIVKTGVNDLNCIGNPYPSAVSADAFVLGNAPVFTNGATVGTTFYFWTHNNNMVNNQYQFSDYATYNFTGGTGTGTAGAAGANMTVPNGNIAAGQSFMVKGIVNGTSVANFKNDMRISGSNNAFFRTMNSDNSTSTAITLEKNRLWLDLTSSGGGFKQILVGYIQYATNNYENGFDGEALEAGNPFSLYSLNDNRKLTIQGRSLPFSEYDQVPLGFICPSAGTYSIGLSNYDGLFEDGNVNVYLEDKMLNVIHNLRQGNYSYVSEPGVFDGRFVLRYSETTLSVNPVAAGENAVIAYKDNSDIHIETSNINMKSVKIFDARGRLILSQENINGKSAVFASPGIANQVLVIQVTSTEGTIVNKKIIF